MNVLPHRENLERALQRETPHDNSPEFWEPLSLVAEWRTEMDQIALAQEPSEDEVSHPTITLDGIDKMGNCALFPTEEAHHGKHLYQLGDTLAVAIRRANALR